MFRLVKQVSIALLTFAGSLDQISEAALSAVAWSWPWGSQVVVKKNDDKDDETKTLVKHIWYNCKNRFNSTPYNSYQKWNNGTCQCKCKEYHKWKKDYKWKLKDYTSNTAQKMKFSIKKSLIHSFLRICSHLLKKILMENFIFCAVHMFLRERKVSKNYCWYFSNFV